MTVDPTFIAFWLLGLFNNASYVILLACAKSISDGGTALVFLALVVPGLSVKLSAPYWFDKVGYNKRLMISTACMATSFMIVGLVSGGYARAAATGDNKVGWELFGVAFGSLQGSLGEASLLALAGKFDSFSSGRNETQNNNNSNKTANITAYSSGTGLAGVFGFAWKVVLNDWLKFSFSTTVLLANVLAVSYWWVFWVNLREDLQEELLTNNGIEEEYVLQEGNNEGEEVEASNEDLEVPRNSKTALLGPFHNCMDNEKGIKRSASGDEGVELYQRVDQKEQSDDNCMDDAIDNTIRSGDELDGEDSAVQHIDDRNNPSSSQSYIQTLSIMERLRLTLSLWPYTIPLFTVYAAEYALQAGTWSAIGFPVEEKDARDKFYEYGNWMYQVGVFVSRSSGTLFTAPMFILWLMPILQCINLVFFYLVATTHFWYNYTLLFPCFYVGLLGGAVYVNGYTRINMDLPLEIREFALSSASVADTLGIVFADFTSLFLQSCLYRANGIDGAVVQCPVGKGR
eukprot:CAMPEP_0185725200 /NCGR_PEP_ID=MMETSP1171-20130828/1498_1 /TAXON_ID=374046 /ORGANISM="Helicotheca tamensis, Strain CCMP826" /LENGTH=514 /DNA_ID=CAMNT_0028393251 /DNA_START=191 /DNA_END=1735 /DNA_ORIENTATION=-